MSKFLKTTLALALVAGVAAPSLAMAETKAKGDAMEASKKSAGTAASDSAAMDENRQIMMQRSKEANEKKAAQ